MDLPEPRRNRIHAVARKAHPIDKRMMLGDSPDSWPCVPLLRSRRDRSDLDKTEPDCIPCTHSERILVHPGSKPERVRKAKPEDRAMQFRRIGPRRELGRMHEQRNGQAMRPLRVNPEEQRLH